MASTDLEARWWSQPLRGFYLMDAPVRSQSAHTWSHPCRGRLDIKTGDVAS
jgi:hypothetical protein